MNMVDPTRPIDVAAIAAGLDQATSAATGVRFTATWESPEGFRIELTLSRGFDDEPDGEDGTVDDFDDEDQDDDFELVDDEDSSPPLGDGPLGGGERAGDVP